MRSQFPFPGRARRVPAPGPIAVVLAGLAAVSLLGAAGPAAAQADPSLQAIIAKLNRLEADLNSLQRNVYRGTVPSGSGSGGPVAVAPGGADVSSQLYVYEESLRRLTAQVEELAHRQRQVEDRLNRLAEDVEFRLEEIEGKLGVSAVGAPAGGQQGGGQQGGGRQGAVQGGGSDTAAASQAPAAQQQAAAQPAGQLGSLAVDPASGQPRPAGQAQAGGQGATQAALTAAPEDAMTGSPRDRYNAALRLIRVGQLPQAQEALQAFLKDYPDDELAGNAQYWLGETYYARNEYEQAAAAFLAGYRNHPKNSKAPDNLLKLGVSLVAMGQKAEACPVFDTLLKEFPDAAQIILDRARQEKGRAGCG